MSAVKEIAARIIKTKLSGIAESVCSIAVMEIQSAAVTSWKQLNKAPADPAVFAKDCMAATLEFAKRKLEPMEKKTLDKTSVKVLSPMKSGTTNKKMPAKNLKKIPTLMS